MLFQGRRHGLQNAVADLGSEGFVHLLKTIEADQKQCTFVIRLFGTCKNLRVPLHEQSTIRQASQLIEVQQAITIGLGGKRVAHTKRELTGVDRLTEHVGGSQAESEQLGCRIRSSGEHDDRDVLQVLVGAYRVENVEPGDLRHIDIEEHNVGLVFRQQLERAGRVGGLDEVLVAHLLENVPQDVDDDGLVVDDHDGGFRGRFEPRVRMRCATFAEWLARTLCRGGWRRRSLAARRFSPAEDLFGVCWCAALHGDMGAVPCRKSSARRHF